MPTDDPRLFPVRGPKKQWGRARRGLRTTLHALDELGRLDPIDTAVVALNAILADQLDAAERDPDESAYTVGVVAGRYQSALELLLSRDLNPAGDDDDGFAALAAAIGMPTDPRDRPEPGPSD